MGDEIVAINGESIAQKKEGPEEMQQVRQRCVARELARKLAITSFYKFHDLEHDSYFCSPLEAKGEHPAFPCRS